MLLWLKALQTNWPLVVTMGVLALTTVMVWAAIARKINILHWVQWNADWLTVAAALLCLMLIWRVPLWQSNDLGQQNEARRTLVQICGGVLAVLGFLLALVRIRHTDKDLAIKESEELAGRYLRAAELLGSVRGRDGEMLNLESRLGAIYSLGRLADESQPDYETIIKVLARYVRANATPLSPLPPLGGHLLDAPEPPGGSGRLRIDLQTAMEVVSRKCPHKKATRPIVDVRGAHLDELELEDADLRGARLAGAKLRYAMLKCSDLRNANFFGADLSGCTLDRVGLQGSSLCGAVLIETGLRSAVFDDQTEFTGANLSAAKFYEAGDKSEESRGLAPLQLVGTQNWERAVFSPEFGQRVRELNGSGEGPPTEDDGDGAARPETGSA